MRRVLSIVAMGAWLGVAQAAPDLLVRNAVVLGRDGADAVLCRDGRILAVGLGPEMATRSRPGATVLDAAGGVVAPGFHDAHVHVESGAAEAATHVLTRAGFTVETHSDGWITLHGVPLHELVRVLAREDVDILELIPRGEF